MFRSWRIGTAFGIPLYLHPTILLLPALVLKSVGGGWFNAVVMIVLTAAIFGCVLLHELGHALTARCFGVRTRDITLYPIGGVASLERMPEKPLQEMAVAVAGPAVNLAIVFLLLPVAFLAVASGLLGPDEVKAFRLDDGLAVIAVKFTVILMVANGPDAVQPAAGLPDGRRPGLPGLSGLDAGPGAGDGNRVGGRRRPGRTADRRRPRLSFGIRHPDCCWSAPFVAFAGRME